jgi:glycosyltransferase involved in cell wall biosynthesis
MLKSDFRKVQSHNQIHFLPNGVEDAMKNIDFKSHISSKYEQVDTIEALYLAHMMKEKGYWEVLELAKKTKGENIFYHFAGNWKDRESEVEFFEYVKENELEDMVIYHGFVSGEGKYSLLKDAHILLYPSKDDAFPLTLLESLSYGIPVIATDEGSIPCILDGKSGIVIKDVSKMPEALEDARQKLINKETAMHCRQRYLESFTLEQFENNLINALKG